MAKNRPSLKGSFQLASFNNKNELFMEDELGNVIKITPTPNQQKLIDAIRDPAIKVVFCQAPTGAGKTFWATRVMLELLQEGTVSRVLYERPVTTVGDHYNPYLKGDLNDKFGPYAAVLEKMFAEHLGQGDTGAGRQVVERLKQQGVLERYDQVYKAGDNLKHEILLADEAQNKSREEIFHLITRPAKGGKVVLVGDGEYQDYLNKRKSGFLQAMEIFRDEDLLKNVEAAMKAAGQDFDPSSVAVVELGPEDIKRDLHTAFVYAAYKEYDKQRETAGNDNAKKAKKPAPSAQPKP